MCSLGVVVFLWESVFGLDEGSGVELDRLYSAIGVEECFLLIDSWSILSFDTNGRKNVIELINFRNVRRSGDISDNVCDK